MIKHINPFKILTLAAFIALPALGHAAGNDDGSEKKKTISKSYTVTASDKLKIENSFGEVVINTWDKNEFKVDIEIYSKATSDEKAQSILDKIRVSDSQSGNTVYFKTDVGHINGNNNNNSDDNDDGDDDNDDNDNKDNNNKHNRHRSHNNNNQEFHINYIVYMPSGNPLQIENSFGKTTVPDFKGLVNLTSKFGGLTTGNLDNVEAIDVEFGKAQIGDVHNGKVTFKFDDKSEIAKVSGNVKINSEFSGHVQFSVGNNIEELNLNESYSTIRLIVQKELSANFNIHTSFGNFHNYTDFKISEDREDDDNSGPHFDKDYSGVAGSGNAKIKIKSSFGTVRLSHSADNSNDEEKEHAEKKERKEKKEKKEKKEVEES